MKTKWILFILGAAAVVAAFAATTKEDEITAQWARVDAVAVHFTPEADGQKWVNRKLSEVIPVGDIEAWTSAPPDVNIFNIYKTLEADAVFYNLDGKYPAINTTYRAIIVSKEKPIFHLEIGRGPDDQAMARLSAEKGIYGYFK